MNKAIMYFEYFTKLRNVFTVKRLFIMWIPCMPSKFKEDTVSILTCILFTKDIHLNSSH